ncbi:MAG: sigma-70 family RNA polymerase sigma factor [Oscillospiraceae bacterium]|nr:sigma-70 family RNA polymerase sigma factor [Oscillospiraceae bacterium]
MDNNNLHTLNITFLQILIKNCREVIFLYLKKVEITGINTATLPVLSDKDREQLIFKMKKGDKKAKDRLVMANLKLILSIIQKINIKNADPDDLFQVGCIGLIKALNNFEPAMNVQFSTYGVVMIMGEIKRYMRDNSILKISRSTKDMAYKALSYRELFSKESGREPTTEEIAAGLDTTVYAVTNAMEAMSPTLSLNEPAFCEEDDSICLMDQVQGEDFENSFISKTVIQDVLHALEKRDKYILNLRFLQGKTQTQVAKIVGISQAQVSRIEKNILMAVKKQLDV